jgi:cytoskeletal protein RodZ
MFHPVGSQPPAVYWRRRLLLLGSVALLVILLILTVKIAASDGNAAASAGGHTTPAVTTPAAPTTHSHSSRAPSTPDSSSSSSKSSSSSIASAPCVSKDLAVTAVAGQSTYHVGDQPVLELQVTNTGSRPCVQNLADSQIELRVYNGESRVWGSHDCQIQPGTNDKTLAMNTPVRVAITWSGLTSQPNCAGTRQRVGAGTYTLYALLAGHTGKATQFTIS